MSRLNPDLQQNPCTRWFEWDGARGEIKWYDKAAKENRTESLPFRFLLLEIMSKVSGWSDSADAAIYSNEVKNTSRETLTVRTSGSNIIAQGKYADIRDSVKSKGGYFQTSLYMAYYEGDDLRIGNLGLKGAALSSWMDFLKEASGKAYAEAIEITGFGEGQKGSITYRYPEFKTVPVKEETDEQAKELCKDLMAYLESKPDYSDPELEKEPPPDVYSAPEGEAEPHPAIDTDGLDDNLPF